MYKRQGKAGVPEIKKRNTATKGEYGPDSESNGLPRQTSGGLFLPCIVPEFRQHDAKQKMSPFAHDAAGPKRKDYGKKAESAVTTSGRLSHGAEYRVVSTSRSSGM